MNTERYKTFLILLVFAAYPLFAQTDPSSSAAIQTFVKKVQGTGRLVKTIQTAEGGLVSLSQKGDQDFLIQKIRLTGERVWEKTLHLSFPYYLSLDAMAQTSDGGYILAGRGDVCNEFYCYQDPTTYGMLIKLRIDGNIEWKKAYSLSYAVSFSSVVATSDGGFVTTGTFSSSSSGPLEVVKFTAAGNVVWIQTFLDTEVEGYELVSGPANGLLLISGISNGARVIKLDPSGKILWKRSLVMDDFVLQVARATANRGLILAGKCAGCNQMLLIFLQDDGTVTWRARYSFTSPLYSIADLIQTPDGGYAAVAKMPSNVVLKIDSSRNLVFVESFLSHGVAGGSIFNTPNGGFLIFSPMGSGLLISKVNSKGIGCDISQSKPFTSIQFGSLKVTQPRIKEVLDNVSLGIKEVGATVAVSRSPETIVCQ